jgi:hypothetical protein
MFLSSSRKTTNEDVTDLLYLAEEGGKKERRERERKKEKESTPPNRKISEFQTWQFSMEKIETCYIIKEVTIVNEYASSERFPLDEHHVCQGCLLENVQPSMGIAKIQW